MIASRFAMLCLALCGCDRLFQLEEVKLVSDGGADARDAFVPPCADGFGAPVPLAVGTRPYTVAAADLDSDGDVDLVSANEESDNVSLLINTGSGVYASATHVSVGDKPEMVAVGQLVGDSSLDLAVVVADQDELIVLEGLGNGTFASPIAFSTGDAPYAVVITDFEGNGTADIAVANYGSNNVTIFVMDSSGGTSSATVAVGTGPLALATARIDADPYPELLVANYDSDDLTVLYGDEIAQYSRSATLGTGNGPNGVAAGNLIADPSPEVLTANFNGGSVTAFGNDSGALIAPMTFDGFGQLYQVATADFDQDGRIDVAVTDGTNDRVTMVYNNGTINAQQRIFVPAGDSPTGLVAADFDSNGYADLAVTNYVANTVSLMFNCTQ